MLEVGAKPVSVSLKFDPALCRSAWKSAISYSPPTVRPSVAAAASTSSVCSVRRVQAPEIQRQAPVDEDPHVVVAAEGQRLAAAVLEEVADLGREAEVVRQAVVDDRIGHRVVLAPGAAIQPLLSMG